jgi:putative deaminase/isomerase
MHGMSRGPKGTVSLERPRQTTGLRLHVFENYEQMSRAATALVVLALKQKPDLLLCLATGASPARTYELLARKGRTSPGLFRQIRILKLDEWGGLTKDNPASCEAYLQERVIRPLRVPPQRCFGFSNEAGSSQAECERVQDWLKQNGPIDLCILGLGANGHLGMNEPGRALAPFCHRAALTGASRRHSMLASARTKPRFGYTLGIGELVQSGQILLLVSGESKQEPLRRLLKKEITPALPASFLWLHPDTTVLCDRAAAPKNS